MKELDNLLRVNTSGQKRKMKRTRERNDLMDISRMGVNTMIGLSMVGAVSKAVKETFK